MILSQVYHTNRKSMSGDWLTAKEAKDRLAQL